MYSPWDYLKVLYSFHPGSTRKPRVDFHYNCRKVLFTLLLQWPAATLPVKAALPVSWCPRLSMASQIPYSTVLRVSITSHFDVRFELEASLYNTNAPWFYRCSRLILNLLGSAPELSMLQSLNSGCICSSAEQMLSARGVKGDSWILD